MKKAVCILLTICVITAGIVMWRLAGAPGNDRTVIVYVSEDQVFAEPILRDFE